MHSFYEAFFPKDNLSRRHFSLIQNLETKTKNANPMKSENFNTKTHESNLTVCSFLMYETHKKSLAVLK